MTLLLLGAEEAITQVFAAVTAGLAYASHLHDLQPRTHGESGEE